MKRWALLVVFLYAMILADVLFGALVAAFTPYWRGVFRLATDVKDVNTRIAWLVFWGWVGTMALAQAALLVVPVRIAGGRPVKKRHVIWTLAAAIFMLLLMAAAMFVTVAETLENTHGLSDEFMLTVMAVTAFLWGVWAIVFAFYAGVREPRTFMSRVVRWLLAGSILELLVAVPAHVLARVRNYCCAGFGTFWGLATGLTVMLFAFGPAVFFLIVRRWASLRHKTDGAGSATGTGTDGAGA